MTTTVVSTNQTTSQYLNTGDELILLDGVSIAVIGSRAIEASGPTENDLEILVAGDVFCDDTAINLESDSVGDGTGSGLHNIRISSTGSVASFATHAVYLQGSGNVVTNFGEISTSEANSAGVRNFGDNFSLRNHGSILGGHGVSLSNAGSVVSDANIVNDGTIQGEHYGINSEDVALELFNTGLIAAADEDGSSTGVRVLDNNGSAGSVINNSGTISGQTYSIALYTNDNIVNNSGTLTGDVWLGYGSDIYDGRGGTINGTVLGGADDDTYIIDDATISLAESAAEGTDEVQSTVGWMLGANFENLTLIGSGNVDGYGNGESNVLTGNIGDNVLNGLGSADTLYGNAGDDKLNGGNGIDLLFGGDGDDRLRGQKGADVLKAEAGNDSISGGEGNDNLFGGDDNDILKGGMGKDKLYGGADADVFLYTKAAQSKNDSTADSIKDFELGLDTIDLSGVAAGTLTFIAGAAFSGTQGEVQVTGATNSTVLVDVDGDGTADMKITVTGVTGITEGDFVL
ncbi:MAG: calcium-binding protein [Rhodobacteraceae bacterium]|nr:calcium-binding protein [Paracoccaceae bacterium]